MKKTLVIVLGICLVAMFAGTVSARDIDRGSKRIKKALNGTGLLTDDSVPGYYQAAAVDTYHIVRYSFESAQGWTTVDHTAQQSIFWHVDDFVGLAGGDYGLLVPISGTKSMWCGTRPGTSNYLCAWGEAPGYGNNWNQHFESDLITLTSTVGLSYHAVAHNEGGGYDQAYVDYLDSNDEWVTHRTYGGYHDTVDVISLTSAETGTSTKFRFHFTADGAWSDQDGLLNTDGGIILDDIEVTADAAVLNTEDFEASTVGDNNTTFWTSFGEPAYGIHSGKLTGLMEPDPCHDDYGTQWGFLVGSTELSSRQDLYPGMYVTPRCLNESGTAAPCQNEGIISPPIDMMKYSSTQTHVQDTAIPSADLPKFGGVLFRFQVYRDLPLDNLVFYTWGVRNVEDGCPGSWKDRNYVYYGPDQDYLFTGENVSDLVKPDSILQLNFGVSDMCDVWGGYYGTCTNHSPSPWFDNVYVERVKTSGPQWSYRHLDLFQDNFPPNADYTGFVRADAANDIASSEEPNRIDPGDSVTVQVTSPVAGAIAGVDASGYENGPGATAEVYMHFKVYDAISGAVAADFAASVDTGEVGPYALPTPVADGTWFKVQGRNARVGSPSTKVADEYMFDINDAIFTYDHVIEYYFSATDINAETNYLPSNALEGGSFEWECLPTQPTVYSILYVDDFEHRGSWNGRVDDYMTPALNAVSASPYDRYDVNAPTSGVGNGLASRINVDKLSMFYEKIIWDSGDLDIGTINNGTDSKEDDCALLEGWADDIDGEGHATNLLVMGDGVITNLTFATATSFMTNTLGVQLVNNSYYNRTGGYTGGGVISPLVSPVAGGPFDGLEAFYAFGGCPIINQLDVLDVNETHASGALTYPDGSFAAVAMDDTTTTNMPKRAITTGFSIMAMRDANSSGAPIRNEFLEKAFFFFENGVNGEITDVEDTPAFTKLHGNYPNPFNPSTTIKYNMKAKGHVSIQIYDVAGRLVNTLVNDVRDSGLNTETWNGINNRGASVASGVYFYRMDTKDYSQTRKMILLR
ncbi:MAG: T9SS type A sorting domain-containing protein [Candidatus Krumholzibacteriota bacterium]|nr:T9SS type A sorting domain-containing protein [Candidatus Krumholzibacteriota bacterium]